MTRVMYVACEEDLAFILYVPASLVYSVGQLLYLKHQVLDTHLKLGSK